MEGDVLALLEKESGDVVCRYTYDDWGNAYMLKISPAIPSGTSIPSATGATTSTRNPVSITSVPATTIRRSEDGSVRMRLHTLVSMAR